MSMRILIAHCRYKQRGGEDVVFESEAAQLRDAGHEIDTFIADNSSINERSFVSKIVTASTTVWGVRETHRLAAHIQSFGPEIVHFHNTFPLLSPSAYYACAAASVPVVHTLHNYRTFCASGMLLRSGTICERCLGKRFYNGVRFGCYRGSRAASIPLVASQYLHWSMNSYQRKVDKFIALTNFAKQKYIEAGFLEEKIVVKPNSVAEPLSWKRSLGDYALFVGRIAPEKGLRTLIRAWGKRSQRLIAVGDGPERMPLEEEVGRTRLNVHFVGARTRQEVMELLSRAQCLIVPSEWYEGFPMTIVEAYSMGVPVVASRIGSLAEVVLEGKTGMLFDAGNIPQLSDLLSNTIDNWRLLEVLGAEAKRGFRQYYSPEANVKSLEHIYSSILAAKRSSRTN